VAANWNARVTVTGFAIFIVASIAWLAGEQSIAHYPERHSPSN
jgi:hypothetical protein